MLLQSGGEDTPGHLFSCQVFLRDRKQMGLPLLQTPLLLTQAKKINSIFVQMLSYSLSATQFIDLLDIRSNRNSIFVLFFIRNVLHSLLKHLRLNTF